jgi:hypothetical protein
MYTKALQAKLDRPQMATLQKLPAEIRHAIFSPCLLIKSKRRRKDGIRLVRFTPRLLIALRTDQGLYKEALGIYYKLNSFCLWHRNFLSLLRRLSPDAIGLIRNIEVKI